MFLVGKHCLLVPEIELIRGGPKVKTNSAPHACSSSMREEGWRFGPSSKKEQRRHGVSTQPNGLAKTAISCSTRYQLGHTGVPTSAILQHRFPHPAKQACQPAMSRSTGYQPSQIGVPNSHILRHCLPTQPNRHAKQPCPAAYSAALFINLAKQAQQ